MSTKKVTLGKPITINTESKRNTKKILARGFAIFLLILLTLESGFAVYAYKNPEILTQYVDKIVYFSNKTDADFENARIAQIAKQPKNVNDIHVAGWIPDWDMKDGFATVMQRPDVFKSVSPVWFFINVDGSLKGTYYTNNLDYINFCKDHRIELIPTISNFNRNELTQVLNNPENLQRHIGEIVSNVVDHNYDGIDLDYEEIYLKDKKLFFDFISELSKQLHQVKKKLVFSAIPKWRSFISPYRGTLMVLDYKRLSDYVDELRIQGYEYSSPGSAKAGPISPFPWLEDLIKYVIDQGVPRDKIVLGINTYAYDWSDRPLIEKLDYLDPTKTFESAQGLEAGEAYYYKAVRGVEKNYGMTSTFNEEWGEAIGTYTYNGKKRVVVYSNDRSIELRKKLAADYGLKGVCYWRIGDEADLKL